MASMSSSSRTVRGNVRHGARAIPTSAGRLASSAADGVLEAAGRDQAFELPGAGKSPRLSADRRLAVLVTDDDDALS